MTDEEAQRALDQQLPVMFRRAGHRWGGPTLLIRCYSPDFWVVATVGRDTVVSSHALRLATPHELLTADGGTQ